VTSRRVPKKEVAETRGNPPWGNDVGTGTQGLEKKQGGDGGAGNRYRKSEFLGEQEEDFSVLSTMTGGEGGIKQGSVTIRKRGHQRKPDGKLRTGTDTGVTKGTLRVPDEKKRRCKSRGSQGNAPEPEGERNPAMEKKKGKADVNNRDKQWTRAQSHGASASLRIEFLEHRVVGRGRVRPHTDIATTGVRKWVKKPR